MQGDVDLLLSDVVMPRMNGADLHAAIQAQNPAVRVLFMSGYASEILGSHGVVEEGVDLIRKPFNIGELLARVHASIEKKGC